MRARAIPVGLPANRGPSTRATRLTGHALLAVASAAGLGLCAIAVFDPRALTAGLPVAMLFYPLLWTAAIAVRRRA
jgi:hypothetical protein